jgi:transcriptional regulator with XRE-family HTH domain
MVVFMVMNKVRDDELGRRLLLLRNKKGISRAMAAKEIGMGLSSLQQYEGGFFPGPKNINKLSQYYGCDKGWLLTGQGKPFPGEAAAPRPDADGSEAAPPHREDAPANAESRSAPIEFRISDALAMTARVLESRTSYATALYLNIVHFDRAVSSESIVSKCEEDLRAQGELLTKMQARLDDLENQNKTLTQEIRELKGVSGDCPPIALGLESAAPTGTDE